MEHEGCADEPEPPEKRKSRGAHLTGVGGQDPPRARDEQYAKSDVVRELRPRHGITHDEGRDDQPCPKDDVDLDNVFQTFHTKLRIKDIA